MSGILPDIMVPPEAGEARPTIIIKKSLRALRRAQDKFFLLRVRIHSFFNQTLMHFQNTTRNKNLFSNQIPPYPPFLKGDLGGFYHPFME